MSLSAAQLLERIQKGESLQAINFSLISPAEQALLRCCAVVRTFDEALVDNYFRPHVGVDKESVPFSLLTGYDFVQRVPRTDGVYSMQAASRKQYYDSWWKSPDGSFAVRPSEVPAALFELTTKLFKHYTDLGDSAILDALIQQVFVDRDIAWNTFETLYKNADAAFDLARCRDIINALRGLESILGTERAEALNESERYLQARSSWATEFYQTVSYYDRKELNSEWESFLTNGIKPDPAKKWILHLHAPGGMGKTMFVRWLIARRCVPEPYTIPCGRLDFDFVDQFRRSEHRWLLLLDLAREMSLQIPGNVFESLIKKFADRERILAHQQIQQATAATDSALPADAASEEEILFLFGEAIRNAKLIKPIVIILDTFEEVILYRPADLVAIVRLINMLRPAIPNLLVILSGRYDLSEPKPDEEIRVPEFNAEFGRFVETIQLKPFADDEALGFLQLRGLSKERPLDAVVERADGNPFKLALFADILLDDLKITEETIRSYESVDLLYLIERVLARIPKTLQWLLRYGVVPRKLTLSFVKDVMKPHLLRAVSGDDSHDVPQRSELLNPKVQKKMLEKEIFLVESPQHDLDLDKLWMELQKYASNSSSAWVTIKPSDPYTAGFHTDVVNPMRRWLEKESVYRLLHEDAIAYFENKAKAEPNEWARHMREAVYHRFQLAGAEATGYWTRLLVNEPDPERRRELTSEIIGSEYVDENLKPRTLLDGRQIIEPATLAAAYYYRAIACVEIARIRNASASDQLWSDAESDLRKAETIQQAWGWPIDASARHGLSSPIDSVALTSVQAAILTNKGLGEQAISILERELEQDLEEGPRLRLEVELARSYSSRGNYQQGVHYWESSLQRAEHIRVGPSFIVEIRRSLARLHRDAFDLEASANELQKAIDFIGPDATLKGELLNELVDLYFAMGQFTRASETSEKLGTLVDEPLHFTPHAVSELRHFNQKLRFLTAIGDPLRALEISNSPLISPVSDLWNVMPQADDLARLFIESIEQRGTLDGILLEIESARENFESARSRWHDRGDTKAVKRCMLKKAVLFLNAGEVKQATAIFEETTRLSIANDEEQALEESLLTIGILHFTHRTQQRAELSTTFNNRAVNEHWRPNLRAKLMLRTGAWEQSPNGKAANHFFVALTDVLRQIRPASARVLLLDPLSDYTSCKEIDYHVAQDLLDLFPLHRYDEDFHVNAPKVAELMRVLGRKDQAVTLLKELLKSGPRDNLFARRRLLLTLARTAPRRAKLSELKVFMRKFLEEYKEFPVLCAATLIEFAELSFTTRSKSDRLRLLEQAEELLPQFERSQWTARLLALRGRLTINDDHDRAVDQLQRAILLYREADNLLAATPLERIIATEERRRQRAGGDVSGKTVVSEPLDQALSSENDDTVIIHVEGNWTTSVTINTTLPHEEVTTRHVPIEPASMLDRLLAFDTYENYSFSFLRQMTEDWINCCHELGHILTDKRYVQKLASFANEDQRKPALSLVIDALQLSSAPWEMMVFPSQSDTPASVSPAVSAFYRSLAPGDPTLRSGPDIVWLQLALSKLGPQPILADGIYGRSTKEAVKNFQRLSGIPDHGEFDGLTRRTLKRTEHLKKERDRPRVLLLEPSKERQRATSRGHEVYGLNIIDWYKRHDFKDVAVVEDPDVGKVREVLWRFEPDVIHICPTMEESTSIGIYLDFGSGGTGVIPSRSGFRSQSRLGRSTPTGDVEFLTLSALSDLVRRHHKPEYPRPLLVLDVLEPRGRTELFTQLFLRNAFAAQLYQIGAFESIIATGLTPPHLQEELMRTLIAGLGNFESLSETVNRLRRLVDLGNYTRLAPVGDNPGPLRDPEDNQYLSNVVATAGIGLFTPDPEM